MRPDELPLIRRSYVPWLFAAEICREHVCAQNVRRGRRGLRLASAFVVPLSKPADAMPHGLDEVLARTHVTGASGMIEGTESCSPAGDGRLVAR